MSDPQPTPASVPPAKPTRSPGVRQLLILVLVLAAGIILTALTSDVSRMSEPGVRVENGQPVLPDQAGPWIGGESSGMTPEERKVLPADTELVRRTYTNSAGDVVYCAIVLAGSDVTSIHRPELCLTGQGWKLDASRGADVALRDAKRATLTVTRMNASMNLPSRNGSPSAQAYSVFVYWFVGKDRITHSHPQRILWTTMDRVLHNRNHRWAYFLINAIAPVRAGKVDPIETQNERMRLVEKFIQDLYPQVAVE